MRKHPRSFVEEKLSPLTPIKYNRFQWWRNYKAKDTLHAYTDLLSRIRNGDFDPSPYFWMAQMALHELDDKVATTKDPEKQRDITGLYMEKYRRLILDYEKDEHSRLDDLKKAFVKHTPITRPEIESLLQTFEGTIEELYNYVLSLYSTNTQSPPKFSTYEETIHQP